MSWIAVWYGMDAQKETFGRRLSTGSKAQITFAFSLLSEKMGEMSQEISKKFGIAVSIHRMLDALDHEGIVIKDNTKNGTRSRKKGGQRCYVLNYSRWVDYMQEIAREFENGCDY